jgi:hypothetical protein
MDEGMLYIVDASSGEVSNVGLKWHNWAQFCESSDYLMYFHYSGDNMLRFWSMADKAEAADTARLELSPPIESISLNSFTRSADSSTLLVSNEDPNCLSYLHLYLVRSSDDE